MGQVIEIPLNSGMDQGEDRVFQEPTVLAYAQNCRLALGGRLEVRPGFTALSSDTYSITALTAFDATNYAGRLLALGTQSTTISTRPTDLFEYVASTATWRATSGSNVGALTGPRLPRLTDVRAIGQVPDFPESIFTAGLAAGGGYVCAAYERLGANTTLINIVDPSTDQSIVLETLAVRRPQVVYLAPYFWIVGVDSDEDIVGCRFDPSTDETLPALSTLVSNATVVVDLAATVMGSNFATCYCTATSAIVHTWNAAGTQQQTWTAFASSTVSVALTSNAAGSLLSVARQAATSLYSLTTFNASGALQTGPTSLFAGEGGSGVRLGMARDSTDLVIVGVDELNLTGLLQRVVQTSHAAGAVTHYRDARPEGAPVVVGGSAYVGVVDMSPVQSTYHVLEESTLLPQAFLAPQLCRLTTTAGNTLCAMASDGTKLYWVVISVGSDGGNFNGLKFRAAVYAAETSGTERRQMVQVGGELLIAGGLPLSYDGRVLSETGFAERPSIYFGGEDTTGALTLLGVYRAIAVWECFDSKGRLVHSQASDPAEHTLAGANDAITWIVSTPHSLRRHPAYADQGVSVRVSVYRTEAGEGVFFLDSQATVDPTDDIGTRVSIVSTSSDVNLIDNLVLYEQSQTPISHVSPQPYRYAAAAREREMVAGLPEAEAYAYSKLLFPGEPVEFAPPGQLGFTGRVSEPIVAVGSFATVGLVWSASSIWQVPGRGPEHNGEGDFDAAAPVDAPGGAIDWRSILVAPPGAFFQMRPDRLMLLERGGGVTWAGSPVQATLALYPEIVGCVFVRALDQVVFACNNALGSDGVLLALDLSSGQWFVDTIGAAISGVSELDGRLVYVSGGIVFQQDDAIAQGAGALPSVRIETASLRFFSALGYGDILKIGLLGTYLGDCTVDLFVSYDDGKTWQGQMTQVVTAAAFTSALTGAAVAAGDPITLLYTPNIRAVDRISVRVDVTHPTNTGGIRMHVLSFEVEAQSGTVRRAARDQR